MCVDDDRLGLLAEVNDYKKLEIRSLKVLLLKIFVTLRSLFFKKFIPISCVKFSQLV